MGLGRNHLENLIKIVNAPHRLLNSFKESNGRPSTSASQKMARYNSWESNAQWVTYLNKDGSYSSVCFFKICSNYVTPAGACIILVFFCIFLELCTGIYLYNYGTFSKMTLKITSEHFQAKKQNIQ